MHNFLTLAGAPSEAHAPLFDSPLGYVVAATLLWGTYLSLKLRDRARRRRALELELAELADVDAERQAAA